jgi:hypothetical protein
MSKVVYSQADRQIIQIFFGELFPKINYRGIKLALSANFLKYEHLNIRLEY